jgi:PPIC-type PPIASE domain
MFQHAGPVVDACARDRDLEALGTGYPPGRWRLDTRQLAQTRIWVAHILIRHRDVPAHLVSLNRIGWASAPEPPNRARKDAFDLAERIAERARRSPNQFAQLAKEFSEDIGTAADGGTLGGIDASYWSPWPQALDAASALGNGEVSKPVETAYGFHVFLRLPPPAEASYSGVHIVIGHDAAPWLRSVLARRPTPARSRAEALILAQSVYEQASMHPDSFEELVQLHSDNVDAVRGGDFGEWSTTRQTPYPLQVERLAHLDIGEVAPPMDGPFGIEIIRRVNNRPRVTYAMERIQIGLQGTNPESAIVEYLQNVAVELQHAPERFEEYERKHCCLGVEVWEEGQGSALHEQVLAHLQIGEIASAPSKYEGGGYAILKRVQAAELGDERVHYEMPSPEKPSIEAFVVQAVHPEVIKTIGQAAIVDLKLSNDRAKVLLRTIDAGNLESAQTTEKRWRMFGELQHQVESLLSAAEYALYVSNFERLVESELLKTPEPKRGFTVAQIQL